MLETSEQRPGQTQYRTYHGWRHAGITLFLRIKSFKKGEHSYNIPSMTTASPLPELVSSRTRQVLERVLVAIEAFWLANIMLTRLAVGATQRVMRLQDGLDALAIRWVEGTMRPWRRRAPRVARQIAPVEPAQPSDPRELAAAADAVAQKLAAPRRRKQIYGLPPYYGWLANQMKNSVGPINVDLEEAFRSEAMIALMLTTPEVARRARPVFRMLKADETLLLVPVGYTGRACGSNHRHYPPEPKAVDRRSDYVPTLVIPPDYDEARDGRKPHPLRSPTWHYQVYEDYRSYLYYFMGRKPNWIRPPP